MVCQNSTKMCKQSIKPTRASKVRDPIPNKDSIDSRTKIRSSLSVTSEHSADWSTKAAIEGGGSKAAHTTNHWSTKAAHPHCGWSPKAAHTHCVTKATDDCWCSYSGSKAAHDCWCG